MAQQETCVMRIGHTALAVVIGATIAFAQAPPGPTFDVVSIKRHVAQPGLPPFGSNSNQRPDGGFTMTNVPAALLISRAYSSAPADMVGLPGWAMSERYDVSATSTLEKATGEDRAAMMRAMLADRFKLAVHFEKREQPVYDLVLARSDGKLGSGLTLIDTDCAPQIAAQRAASEAGDPPGPPVFPDLKAPPPPCTLRSVRGRTDPSDRMEGEATMASLAGFLRLSTGRVVIDKTGLPGSYRVRMNFDLFGSRRGPQIDPAPETVPDVFTAAREQLGLKLESSKAVLDTLIIDRFERPTEN
jgi:uncharacterized protein (TIGR03435 family)